MIRLRDSKGKVVEAPDTSFVEICSEDGKVVRVLTDDGEGRVQYLIPADAEFQRYLKVMRVEAAEEITLE